MKRVLILGAGGFIGHRLVHSLAKTGWAAPIAAVRSVGTSFPSGIEVRICDATDGSALRAAIRNSDCVVNCVFSRAREMVVGADLLFSAALEARVERVIHLSSMAVYGGASGVVDEETPLTDDIGWYGRAKIACERLAATFAQQGGAVVILRPSCVYGPGSELWTARIARLLRAGRIGDLGVSGDGYCNLVYIDDLTNAVLAALRRPDIEGQVFNLSNPDPERWNQYFIRLGLAINATPIRRIAAPSLWLETVLRAPPLKVLEIANRRIAHLAYTPDPIPPSLARLWRQQIIVEAHKSEARLGLPYTPLDQGIAASVAWLCS